MPVRTVIHKYTPCVPLPPTALAAVLIVIIYKYICQGNMSVNAIAPRTMKILMYGSTGWIGTMLLHLLRQKKCTVLLAKARLQNVYDVEAELDTVKPDRVVLCAGITGRPNVDWCESHQEETAAVNFYGTVGLVKACEQRNVHITNFATGCIFEYDNAHPIGGDGFTEDSAPNFFGSFYSKTKAAAEAATRDCRTHLLLRVRMPITCDRSPRCFVTKIATYPKIVNVPNSMSVLPDLLPLALRLILDGDVGVYNFVNPGVVSHAEILDAYKAVVDPFYTYVVMDQAEHDTVTVAKRSNNALDTTKLQARFPDVRIPLALESVIKLFETHKPLYQRLHIARSVLVTGGAGFIGSGFLHHILKIAPTTKITVLDNFMPCASVAHLLGLHVQIVNGSIEDLHAVKNALTLSNADTIVHFAAQTHVDNSFGNSLEFTRTNVMGTHVLLECARTSPGVKRFVHVSTDEVYGETLGWETEAMSEGRILMPTNPYAASKVGAEALVHAYFKSYNLPVVTIRLNNVFGPRQYPEKVVPRFLVRYMSGLPLQFQGSGLQSRHFLYVDDAVSAITIVLGKGVLGNTYNIGSDEEYTIQEVAAKIQGSDVGSHAGGKDDDEDDTPLPILHTSDRPFNDQRYWLNDERVRQLGWQPKVSFAEGLARTREWYTGHLTHLQDIWPTAWDAVHSLDDTNKVPQ
jgi:dTDP-glucose 4,6-dehydratase